MSGFHPVCLSAVVRFHSVLRKLFDFFGFGCFLSQVSNIRYIYL